MGIQTDPTLPRKERTPWYWLKPHDSVNEEANRLVNIRIGVGGDLAMRVTAAKCLKGGLLDRGVWSCATKLWALRAIERHKGNVTLGELGRLVVDLELDPVAFLIKVGWIPQPVARQTSGRTRGLVGKRQVLNLDMYGICE